MSRLDKIRANSELAAETLDPEAMKALEEGKATQAQIDAARNSANAQMLEDQRLAQEAQDALKAAKPPIKDTLDDQPVVGEVQAVKRVTGQRSYVLKAGKDLGVPIRFPNGQIVTVQFRDGHKTLTGRMAKLFHTEYMSSPALRMKVAEVKQENADAVALAYRQNNPVARAGNQEAGNSSLPARAVHEAQMREMQRRAAEGKNVTEHVAGHTIPTENGNTLG